MYGRIFVIYGDCGTAGGLDTVLAEEGVERIPGPHCYAFYQGVTAFLEAAEAEPGCFYLTDYLVRQFDKVVIAGLGLDRHPELLPLYFGNYTKLVYLAQAPDPVLVRGAGAAAERLLDEQQSERVEGGERRRVEIARALATEPSFILLDEPFAGIDPIAVGDIRALVAHLKDRGIGVLITDHNVRETLDVIDRAYIIHDGMLLMEGSPADIVGNPDVRRVYLGDRFSL